jgi:hypothetical protein
MPFTRGCGIVGLQSDKFECKVKHFARPWKYAEGLAVAQWKRSESRLPRTERELSAIASSAALMKHLRKAGTKAATG